MFQMLVLLLFISLGQSVLIKPVYKKETSVTANGNNWEYVKVYHPPKQQSWHKYEPYVSK